MLYLPFDRRFVNSVGEDIGLSLPAQESYNEAHQQNAQPLHYLPAGTNILALLAFSYLSQRHETPKTGFCLLRVCVNRKLTNGSLLRLKPTFEP